MLLVYTIHRNFMKNLYKYIFIILLVPFFLNSCGLKDIRKPVDLRTEPLDPDKRAKKNINEGKGISLGSLRKSNTTYEFSTSNPMWRASLETLDFIPLATVDYSGGLIITDWYSDGVNSDGESLKITVRFLSNEIRTDSLKIIVHRKYCKSSNNCSTSLLPQNSKIKGELLSVILRKASLLEKNKKK